MSYEAYKLLHLAAIFVFLSGVAVLLLGRPGDRFWKILTGVASVVVLVAGMGLLARLGGGFPGWVIAKLVLWTLATALGHVVAKRFPRRGPVAFWATLGMAAAAAAFAIFKPF